MAVKATYELHIDLDGDRDFTDPGEDFSGDWKVMEWRLGMTGSFDGLAREATLSLTLHNADGRFSPEHGSALSGFTPGALVRVRSIYNLTTRQHFIGWIEPGGIKPLPGTKGRRETQVTVNGYFGRLQEAEVKIALQENQPTDALVAALVDAAKVYPPGMTGWLLGMTGFSTFTLSNFLNISEAPHKRKAQTSNPIKRLIVCDA